jgi:hypothetical protein
VVEPKKGKEKRKVSNMVEHYASIKKGNLALQKNSTKNYHIIQQFYS